MSRNASVEAELLALGLELDISSPAWDIFNEQFGELLICYVSVNCDAGVGERLLTSTTLSTSRRLAAMGAPMNGDGGRRPIFFINRL